MKKATTSVLLATAVAATTLATVSPSSAQSSTVQSSTVQSNPAEKVNAGAGWLAGQLKNGQMPSTWSPGTTDWGLTADTIFALTSRRVAGSATQSATDALATNVLSYISPSGGASRSSGGVAKSLLVAVTQGRNANAFGGQNLVSTLESMQTLTGTNTGRYSDLGTTNDYSSAFSQSLAIIALSRLGRLSEPSVDFLLNMQCANGGFPYSPSFTTSRCDNNTDVDNDATSFVVQALSAPGVSNLAGVETAKRSAVDYLKTVQKSTGAFDSPPWINDNASTTGLAAQALRLAGEATTANKATGWLASLSVSCTNAGASEAHVGAIAADPSALGLIKSVGVDNGNIDQLRRSTSQGLLGFADSDPFTTMSRARGITAIPTNKCPKPVVPAKPKVLRVTYAANMRTATVAFHRGAADDVVVRSRSTRSGWTGWRSLTSRSAATVRTSSVVQAVAGKGGATSGPVTISLAAVRAQGPLRGCPAIGAVTVRYPNSRVGVLKFSRRTTSCAAFAVHAGSQWRPIRRLQSALAVPLHGGTRVVRLRTGFQVVVIRLGVPRQ